MSEAKEHSSRRDFLKIAGSFAAGVAVSGRCDGENCYRVPGPGLKAHGIELDQPILIAFRAYCEPATKVVLRNLRSCGDRAIKFSPRK